MKKKLVSMGIAAALLAEAAGSLVAQTNVALKIHTAIELEYPTQIGKAYRLQGTTDLNSWIDIGNPVLGHGRVVNHVFSTKEVGPLAFASYRVVISQGPTNGFAPWSLTGARLSMDEISTNRFVEFGSDSHGRDHYVSGDDGFAYEYTRLSENDSRVERFYTPDRRETVRYSYTGPGMGTWVRDEFRQDVLERHGAGIFRYLSDTTNGVAGVPQSAVPITAIQPPAPPTHLVGLVYYVLSGSSPDQLTFQTGTSGLEQPVPSLFRDTSEAEVSPGGNVFSYTYLVKDDTSASLVVNFGYYGFGGDKNEYDLTYSDGPSGTFVRRIYRLGSLAATDSGAFSPYAPAPVKPVAPDDTGTSIPSTNPPPVALSGLILTIQDRSTPSRLTFRSAVAGVEFDDSAPSDFAYSYTVSDETHFKLVVQFKADRWDEYDLIYSAGNQGTLVHREFKNGKLSRTLEGAFTVTRVGP